MTSEESAASSAAREREPRVPNPAWFAAVMGTAGTGEVLALNPLGIVAAEPVAAALGWVIIGIAGLMFLWLSVLFWQRRRNPWQDMGSPIIGPSFATIPGAMMVIITAVIALLPESVESGLWWWGALGWNAVGAGLAVLVTVRLFAAAFVADDFPVERMSGVWFVPETALILSGMVAGRLAITGPADATEPLVIASVAAVGAGVILFFLTAAVFFTRLILHPHMRSTGAPAMWIMLSPLSISALAIHQVGADATLLNSRLGSPLAAVSDLLAMLMWGFSLWWIAAAGTITWYAGRRALTNSSADWSYVFPPAAMTIATITLGRVWGSATMGILGAAFAGVLIFVWVVVGTQALQRLRTRRIAPVN